MTRLPASDEKVYRMIMDFQKPPSSLVRLVLFLALVMAGCSGAAPYVFHQGEFNRDNPNYGAEPKDIETLTICYAKNSTTPEEVRKLATSECAKFKKDAFFVKQDYLHCPMTAPVSAHFDCLPR